MGGSFWSIHDRPILPVGRKSPYRRMYSYAQRGLHPVSDLPTFYILDAHDLLEPPLSLTLYLTVLYFY